jgi:toxin-antitoxin system PIN domain toxin
VSLAVDANILIYASDDRSEFHAVARSALAELAAGPRLVYLFWPVVMAYLRIITHPAILEAPLASDVARDNVRRLTAVPHVRSPGEEDGFWSHFVAVAEDGDARGNLVPDAHLVALMRQYGVRTIWTNDRDFRRFSDIEVHDPFS